MPSTFHRDDATFAQVGVNDISGGMLRLTQDTTFYVNPQNGGSDGNSGLTSTGGSWATIQHGVDYIANSVDPAGYQVILQVYPAAGAYPGVTLSNVIHVKKGGWPYKPLVLRGNVATPTSGPLISDNSQSAIQGVGVHVAWMIEGFQLQSSIAAIEADWGTQMYVGKNHFPYVTPNQIVSIYGSKIEIIDDITCSAGDQTFFYAAFQGQIILVGTKSLTLTGTPNFASAFAISTTNSVITVAGATFTGAATGAQYSCSYGGGIVTGGLTLPGTAASGVVVAPGWYA